MPAGDMAGLVREHADDLVRSLRFHQRARVHEDVLAVHDESVEGAFIDDDDVDILLRKPRHAQDRLGIIAQQLLDLGVADQRQAGRQLRAHRTAWPRGGGECDGCEQRKRTRGWRPPPPPDRSRTFGHVRWIYIRSPAQPSGAKSHGQRGLRSHFGVENALIRLRNTATAGRLGRCRPPRWEAENDARFHKNDCSRPPRAATCRHSWRWMCSRRRPESRPPAGASSIWRSASPRRLRRRRQLRRRARRLAAGRSATPRRSAFLRCARASRVTTPNTYRLPIAPERIVVTTGSSAGFMLAFLAMFEAGDRVAVATPGYPPYRHILSALGCECALIETTESYALGDDQRNVARGAREKTAAGRADRKPGQSDRHHDECKRARATDQGGRRRRASA